MKRALQFLIVIFVLSCNSEKPVEGSKINSFDDPEMVAIENLQDTRDVAGLLTYFNNENPMYRKAAAEAFASVQDTASIDQLSGLLNDEVASVRKMAGYALGQTFHADAADKLFNRLAVEDSVAVRKVLWEALGKCITKEKINYLSEQEVTDLLEKEGFAWGIYRAGIRGVYNDTLVNMSAQFLYPENTFETRFAATHFLARIRNTNIDSFADSLLGSAMYDKSAFVRIASASALRNSKNSKVINAIKNTIAKDADYRVRINALRTMFSYELIDVQEALFDALNDENVNVALTAVSILSFKANDAISERLVVSADSTQNWRVRAGLLGAALKTSPQNESIVESIKSKYQTTNNPYEKAALISAIGNSFLGYDFIVTQMFSNEEKVISTSGIDALGTIRRSEKFPEELASSMADVLKEAILTGDIAMIGTATGIISNPEYKYKELYDSIEFLYQAKEKLELPKDNEGLQSLQAAIDFFEGNEETTPVKNEYNHPINWGIVKSIPSNQRMKISTKKGDIIIEMLVDDAPGSVANFIELAREGYYDDKNFHRVVPNFVVQGGCNRGDGWGGENYSIRSEFAPLKYAEGYIGMASAGKDTEGTQWFITHSPTPHLDGGYTIFSRVVEGMNVVHQLEVGDKIISVEEL